MPKFWLACFTIAAIPARIAGGKVGHAATIAANSGSVGTVKNVGEATMASLLPDLLPAKSETSVFLDGNREGSSPVAPTFTDISLNAALTRTCLFGKSGSEISLK